MQEELLKKVSVSNASWKIENSFLNEIDSRRVSEKFRIDGSSENQRITRIRKHFL